MLRACGLRLHGFLSLLKIKIREVDRLPSRIERVSSISVLFNHPRWLQVEKGKGWGAAQRNKFYLLLAITMPQKHDETY